MAFICQKLSQTWECAFKVKLWKSSKNSYFSKRALHVSLPFGLRVNSIFLQGYRKVLLIVGEKLRRTEIAYFLSSCLWEILIIITCSTAKKYVIVIFFSWSKPIFSHFSKLISQLTEAALHVFLGKNLHATLLKSQFTMDILL